MKEKQQDIKRGMAAFALFKLLLVLFSWWGKDPEEPVTWGELRWIFLLEFIVLAYLLYALHMGNLFLRL